MNFFKYFILSVSFLIMAGCWSPSGDVVDNFKKIDESLEKSNDSISKLAQNIKFPGADEKISDSLSVVLNDAYSYFKNLKEDLESMDKQGERLDVAESLLIQTPKGDSLFRYVMSMYDIGIQYGDSSVKDEFVLARENDKNKWLKKYFKMVPTIAARTILSKFQNDCNLIRMSVSGAWIRQLKNEILSESN